MGDNLDPWAGLIDPRAALKAAKEASSNFRRLSQTPSDGCERKKATELETYDSSRSFRNFRSPHVALSQSRKENPKDRKETCSSSLSMDYANPGSLDRQTDPDFVSFGASPPAKAAKLREYDLTHYNYSEIALAGACESFSVTNTVPSPTAHLRGPREWRDGVALLDRSEPPCPGFRPGEWKAILRTLRHFMDHCAEGAAARGWAALDLFGVHPVVGAVRVDCCGALMLPGPSSATAITTEAITFGPLVYRKRAMPQAVLVWEFGTRR